MLRVRINTDGDAFADGKGPEEVAFLMQAIALDVLHGKLDGVARDRYGNTCGQWDLRFDRSQKESK